MGTFATVFWENENTDLPKRDRRSGHFHPYLPDKLVGASLVLDRDDDRIVAEAERAVQSLNPDARDLEGIARFLLRSEAIASSKIEGVAPSPGQVALAELGQTESVSGVGEPAKQVANNMTIVRTATTRLMSTERVSVEDIVALRRALLPDEPHHHGFRTVQNWIGGSDWHPLDADFVPPPAEMVGALMDDLETYLAGGVHSPIVQAALIHAQFETIHPFSDGNGRVGRALIHTVLARRGLTQGSLLPISLVLATLRDSYVDGLTLFRYDAKPHSAEAHVALGGWVRLFAEAAIVASDQARQVAAEIRALRQEWDERLASTRHGKRALRSDSATFMILGDLLATPVLTAQTVERIHEVSRTAATRALDELRDAGILETRSIGNGRQAFVARGILDLITWAERRMASTRFDTRLSPPRPGVPARPPGS